VAIRYEEKDHMSKEYFEAVAPQWDGMRKGFFSQAVRDNAFATAEVRSGMVAVDVGAGTGFMTEGLISKGVHVIAVDESESMIRELRKLDVYTRLLFLIPLLLGAIIIALLILRRKKTDR
jgi:ubiquinone/menaquinone biosynthesis C-methylase UbiE